MAKKIMKGADSADMVYCMGLIGAAVYYVSNADGIVEGFVGILKAFVWPAFVVFELMKSLAM